MARNQTLMHFNFELAKVRFCALSAQNLTFKITSQIRYRRC